MDFSTSMFYSISRQILLNALFMGNSNRKCIGFFLLFNSIQANALFYYEFLFFFLFCKMLIRVSNVMNIYEQNICCACAVLQFYSFFCSQRQHFRLQCDICPSSCTAYCVCTFLQFYFVFADVGAVVWYCLVAMRYHFTNHNRNSWSLLDH